MALFAIAGEVLKSLFSKPATLMYPAVPRKWQAATRGHIGIDISACIFCGVCSRKCPTRAIMVDRPAKCWEIERLRCIQCSCCVEVCPKKCLTMEQAYTSPSTGPIRDSFHA
jgi:formate hydrogenlyase subunit 6/NADH:ubiquinone oxidoreductase subunit I